ncbi:MAG: flagellar biosynthesis protein FlgB [Acidimicrobiia bacterium]|nr:flagellar biosynthesis protein FlgB [Acidimicrobiia bacterium]
MNNLFTDTTTWALEHALNAVAERQRASANNIANAATPQFRAVRVDFEESLGRALRSGHTDAAVTTRRTNGARGINGNDVSLEEESSLLLRTEILYEALIAAENYKLGLVRTAIRGSA